MNYKKEVAKNKKKLADLIKETDSNIRKLDQTYNECIAQFDSLTEDAIDGILEDIFDNYTEIEKRQAAIEDMQTKRPIIITRIRQVMSSHGLILPGEVILETKDMLNMILCTELLIALTQLKFQMPIFEVLESAENQTRIILYSYFLAMKGITSKYFQDRVEIKLEYLSSLDELTKYIIERNKKEIGYFAGILEIEGNKLLSLVDATEEERSQMYCNGRFDIAKSKEIMKRILQKKECEKSC